MAQASLTEANRKAFDAFAETYNAHPWQQRLAKQILEVLQSRKEWFGVRWSEQGKERNVKLLDYACGTGAASIALKPFVTQILGMDLSAGMVQRYNEAMNELGLSHEQAHAVVRNLASDSTASDDDDAELFDAAVVSLALHHVDDPGLIMQKLAQQLKPDTGVLIILDFMPFKHRPHEHKGIHAKMAHTITQHGFTQQQMQDLFQQSAMVDFGFEVIEEPVVVGDDEETQSKKQMFVAKARRAAD